VPRRDEHRRALTGAVPPAPLAGVFAHTAVEGFEQVAFCHDAATGLRAVIAIHSTVLGPALGGTRFRAYPSEADAVADVCRLARGMTYKHAVSGLDCGGGKAVIVGDPRTQRSEPLLRAYARFVDGLAGRYLTAEDVGTTQADMDLIRRETPHVTGVSESLGGSGDPSPATAWGVLAALRTVGRRTWGTPSLDGRHVVVVGVGKVGRALVAHLVADGAQVTVADVDPEAVEAVVSAHGVDAVDPAKAHGVECDVLSPCALGGVLNARTIPELRCGAVCGSANNQLEEPADGQRLAESGVLFAPDYVVSAGGVINIAEERTGSGYDHDRAWTRIAGIEANLATVLDRADADGFTPEVAADRVAEARIEAMAGVRRIRTSRPEPMA
jgi:glutamate dehydrogenase/leucine dehydrogenase